MVMFVLGFILGGMAFSVVLLFMIGATKNERENEIYREGFNDGYEARFGNEWRGRTELNDE